MKAHIYFVKSESPEVLHFRRIQTDAHNRALLNIFRNEGKEVFEK